MQHEMMDVPTQQEGYRHRGDGGKARPKKLRNPPSQSLQDIETFV